MSIDLSKKDCLFDRNALILVTGANGWVASSIITEALALGLRVRGTVRNPSKIAVLDEAFRSSRYSTVVVSDFESPGAFDEAVQGVDAIFITATKLPGPLDPKEMIPGTVASVLGILDSAMKAPTVKRVVYTGTVPIVFRPGENYKNDSTTWADREVAAAWAPPPFLPDRAFINYKASKNEAEKAMFEFAKKNKPHFTVNSVLPCACFGKSVVPRDEAYDFPKSILRGEAPMFGGNGQWYIDIVDVARIHLAAAIDSTVTGQRLMAAANKFNWNEMIDVVQQLVPSAKVTSKSENPNIDLGECDNAPGLALLNKWWGQKSYTSFEQTIRSNLDGAI